MPTKKRTKITIETHQILILRKPGGRVRSWCAACAMEGDMVSAEQAAVIAAVGLREICGEIEAGLLHHRETPDGLLVVCLNSLLNAH